MRAPRDNDFFVELPNVGTFRFGRRVYGDRPRIRAEYLGYVKQFGDDDAELAAHAAVLATYKVMCVECPKGWEDLENIDLIERPEVEDQVIELYTLLKETEDSFRQRTNQVGEKAGAGAGA